MSFYDLFRPEPKFRVGQLMLIDRRWNESDQSYYLLIDKFGWVSPKEGAPKTWVYGGLVYQTHKNQIIEAPFRSSSLAENILLPVGTKVQ